ARIAQAAADRKAGEQLTRQLEAQHAAAQREKSLRSDAAAARTELDRLRDAIRIAARRDPVPGAATDAGDQPASTSDELLAQCGQELVDLARVADGHASDVRTLIESWP